MWVTNKCFNFPYKPAQAKTKSQWPSHFYYIEF